MSAAEQHSFNATSSERFHNSIHRVEQTPEKIVPSSVVERLRLLRDIVTAEGDAIHAAAKLLSSTAVKAAEMTAACEGCVIVTGVGKAGWVGQKLAATLASTGSTAHFLHPSEAVHGDLGRVRACDIVWALSNSGRSDEVNRIASHLRENSSGLISITATPDNPLADCSDCVVTIGKHSEACPNGLAPTTSTAVMMAVGDAIAMLASQLRSFSSQDFARFHPGGALGSKLASVNHVMRDLDACRIASDQVSVRDAMISCSKNGRRTGAVMLVNDQSQFVGIFTDSDLARLLEKRNDDALDRSISCQMTASPRVTYSGTQLQEAIAIMSRYRISELPVLDDDQHPIGLIDITDIAAMLDQNEKSK